MAIDPKSWVPTDPGGPEAGQPGHFRHHDWLSSGVLLLNTRVTALEATRSSGAATMKGDATVLRTLSEVADTKVSVQSPVMQGPVIINLGLGAGLQVHDDGTSPVVLSPMVDGKVVEGDSLRYTPGVGWSFDKAPGGTQ